MNTIAPNRAIATVHGSYIVQGLDRFAVGGDMDAEVVAAVARHERSWGRPPRAVVWDDAVLNFRAHDLSLGLTRIQIPTADHFLAGQLDHSARVAVHTAAIPPEILQTSDALALLREANDVAHAPALARLIGWPNAAPLRDAARPAPSQRAGSISVVINYRDRSSVTATSLISLRQQVRRSRLEIILIDNQSRPAERHVVQTVADQLFGADPEVGVVHLTYDAPFNHSAQCNHAAAEATGDVLVMLSNDCALIDPDLLQAMADWAMEPGAGVVGPRLVDGDGFVSGAGIAISERHSGYGELHLHEAEIPYLSQLVRLTNGASFACAAVTRATWNGMGGADAEAFPIDYNDADFCLRATKAGLLNMYVGTHHARHSAGLANIRTREGAKALHAALAARHDFSSVPRLNPSASPVKAYPIFADAAAAACLCDYVRLYRQALEFRRSGATLDPGLSDAFGRLEAVTHEAQGRGMPKAGFTDRIDAALRAVCVAFAASQRSERLPDRYHKSLRRLDRAFAKVKADAQRPVLPLSNIAEPPQPPSAPRPQTPEHHADEDVPLSLGSPPPQDDPAFPVGEHMAATPDQMFVTFTDAMESHASERLLIFADAFGPSQQVLFVEALKAARRRGTVAVQIVTEEDLQNLRSMRGAQRLAEWLSETFSRVRPTATIFSRFGDPEGFRAIQATSGFRDVPCLFHLDDDFFALPAVIGTDRYREARHPRRIHCLNLIAAEADLIVASTPLLVERLGILFGARKVALCPMHEGGEPLPRRSSPNEPVVGYYGSATHNHDLQMIAPALRQLKADRPSLRIEIVGSVARRSAAAALGDLVVRRSELEPDYGKFRRAMREWKWTVGLAPLTTHPFNAAKTPIKWTEYAAAGIPVIASRTEPYLALGREGALLLASPDEWYALIAAQLDDAPRRTALLDASDRRLLSFEGWARMERRLLGLVNRAAIRHGVSRIAA